MATSMAMVVALIKRDPYRRDNWIALAVNVEWYITVRSSSDNSPDVTSIHIIGKYCPSFSSDIPVTKTIPFLDTPSLNNHFLSYLSARMPFVLVCSIGISKRHQLEKPAWDECLHMLSASSHQVLVLQYFRKALGHPCKSEETMRISEHRNIKTHWIRHLGDNCLLSHRNSIRSLCYYLDERVHSVALCIATQVFHSECSPLVRKLVEIFDRMLWWTPVSVPLYPLNVEEIVSHPSHQADYIHLLTNNSFSIHRWMCLSGLVCEGRLPR